MPLVRLRRKNRCERLAAKLSRLTRRSNVTPKKIKVSQKHRSSVAEQLEETEAALMVATEVHEGLVKQFANAKRKVDSVGLTSSVGALLRKQKTTLPDVAARRAAVAERQKLINDTQYTLFEYEEAQEELSEMDDAIKKILVAAQKDSTKNVAILESAARDLMTRKREYLADLVRSSGQYFDKLIELDTVDRQIIKLEAGYENYIDQRVLWIRSSPPLTAGVTIEDSAKWFVMPASWKDAGRHLAADAKQSFVLYIACLSMLALLLCRGRAIRKTITVIGRMAEKVKLPFDRPHPSWSLADGNRVAGVAVDLLLPWLAARPLCRLVLTLPRRSGKDLRQPPSFGRRLNCCGKSRESRALANLTFAGQAT